MKEGGWKEGFAGGCNIEGERQTQQTGIEEGKKAGWNKSRKGEDG